MTTASTTYTKPVATNYGIGCYPPVIDAAAMTITTPDIKLSNPRKINKRTNQPIIPDINEGAGQWCTDGKLLVRRSCGRHRTCKFQTWSMSMCMPAYKTVRALNRLRKGTQGDVLPPTLWTIEYDYWAWRPRDRIVVCSAQSDRWATFDPFMYRELIYITKPTRITLVIDGSPSLFAWRGRKLQGVLLPIMTEDPTPPSGLRAAILNYLQL